jgi:peroxiredoxin
MRWQPSSFSKEHAMVLTPSTMLPLGTVAPDFTLPDVRGGGALSLSDLSGQKALVVIFLCNHCPYVKHIAEGLARFGRDYHEQDVAVVAISSNDARSHPEDGPRQLAAEAERQGYPFPVLYDESQEVAKAYSAACTPDFFVFDSDLQLVYRGQFDSSRPENGEPVSGQDLRAAVDALLRGGAVSGVQKPSLGCNITWKAGNEPEYFRR